jgi:hypothetical protein
MQQIATIAFVQIQRSPMKSGTGVDRVYQPAPLLQVENILLTDEGIFGVTAQGEQIIDVHHARHPQSRFRGDNRISFGFLSNYVAMRQRFGSHIVDGIAGENILLRTASPNFELRASTVYLQHADDGTFTELKEVIPAPPCREFSEFCAQFPLSAPELKATLQFLDSGRRGYYAEIATPDRHVMVKAGDTLWV